MGVRAAGRGSRCGAWPRLPPLPGMCASAEGAAEGARAAARASARGACACVTVRCERAASPGRVRACQRQHGGDVPGGACLGRWSWVMRVFLNKRYVRASIAGRLRHGWFCALRTCACLFLSLSRSWWVLMLRAFVGCRVLAAAVGCVHLCARVCGVAVLRFRARCSLLGAGCCCCVVTGLRPRAAVCCCSQHALAAAARRGCWQV